MKKIFGRSWLGRGGLGAVLLTLVSCGGDGQNNSPIVTGIACAADHDCASGQVCGFRKADECAATKGVCLVYPIPGTAHCSSIIVACGCSNNQVVVPCDYPDGYAPGPTKNVFTASCM